MTGRVRLTDTERRERDMLEAELEALLIDPHDGLAPILGWETLHILPGIRAKGRWWTATTGSLAAWPDLVLVRGRDSRIIFAELKRELEQPTERQAGVLAILRELENPPREHRLGVRVDVVVWRPSDLREPLDRSNAYRILR